MQYVIDKIKKETVDLQGAMNAFSPINIGDHYTSV